MTKPPLWRNVEVLKAAAQVGVVLAVGITLWWLINNLLTNLDEQNIPFGLGFLDDPAGFQVRDSSFDPQSPIWKLIGVGIQNTLISAVVGITLAVVLGVLIGIGRLSTNWVLRKLTTLYVEVFRNIPPLVIIIFVGAALFVNNTALPAFNPSSPPRQIKLPGTDDNFMILSKSRLGFPSVANDGNSGLFWLVMLAVLVVAIGVWRWRTKVNVDTGQPHHRVLYSLATILGLGLIAFVALGGPLRMSWPTVSESGRLIEGGLPTNDAFVALTLALGLYTASHIAEIIRGSILAVPIGQNEAANALALTGFQRYRFVVLPQALRIAMPPVINQFLNLTKNTSLAVAVAYPDVTQVIRTAIGNGQPATQMILALMIVYLTFSLVTSLVLNVVNRRFQLVGR
ncbi:MAG: ABC transporter permease subunit [Ilumatobacter sp.]|uniref:amino acid ABC transporter permease n=1 Tax=Ilumatobacter sp. TaxID=1967498 RepID=UPI00260E7636|nr:ABC transporter permease subunit [Ilumatobacter sp.]MDJ0768499.1 ABC transporter permease subunit [Ilumatobacter sp.]